MNIHQTSQEDQLWFWWWQPQEPSAPPSAAEFASVLQRVEDSCDAQMTQEAMSEAHLAEKMLKAAAVSFESINWWLTRYDTRIGTET